MIQRAMSRQARKSQVRNCEDEVQEKKLDENKHLVVSENALMELMDLCEPLEEQ